MFLDVHGVLIPFGMPRPTIEAQGNTNEAEGGNTTNPLVGRIRVDVGRALADLPYDLVWATTWGADANGSLTGLLGLPSLPVVEWPDASADEEHDIAAGRHWKTRALVAWAAGRPFAWVDDEITDRDRYWVAGHHPALALLHHINPATGLTNDDIDRLARWATTLRDM